MLKLTVFEHIFIRPVLRFHHILHSEIILAPSLSLLLSFLPLVEGKRHIPLPT